MRKELLIDNKLRNLDPEMERRVKLVIQNMLQSGFDPILFEGRRSQERQKYLYSIGRRKVKYERCVTWTLRSKHITGCAADIISKSRGWNNEKFFDQLGIEAKIQGLKQNKKERCHLEMK
jgi:hypothetical protein